MMIIAQMYPGAICAGGGGAGGISITFAGGAAGIWITGGGVCTISTGGGASGGGASTVKLEIADHSPTTGSRALTLQK